MSQLAAGAARPAATALALSHAAHRLCRHGDELVHAFLHRSSRLRAWPPLALGGLLLLVELGFYFWSEFAERRQPSGGVERLTAPLAPPVLILLGWRLFLPPGLPAGDMRWIPAVLRPGHVGGSRLLGDHGDRALPLVARPVAQPA